MALDEAVVLCGNAEMDLADPLQSTLDLRMLPFLHAGLALPMNWGMEEGNIKSHSLIWGEASVSLDRDGDNNGAQAVNRRS